MIGTINLDKNISDLLSKKMKIKDISSANDIDHKGIEGIIIDWVGKSDTKFLSQIGIVDGFIRKKIPIMIYDRYMKITSKEYKWLSKFNVKFFEPKLNRRFGFSYLPQWQALDDQLVIGSKEERSIDLGHKGTDTKSRHKYYKKFHEYCPDYNMVYDKFEWSDVRFTIGIGSIDDYDNGFISEDVFDAMKNGCLVLLPQEHKYFHPMFSNYNVISDHKMIKYFIQNFTHIMNEDSILAVYENIRNHYPEFTIDYAVDVIIGVFE
jgi:hypothetical protein